MGADRWVFAARDKGKPIPKKEKRNGRKIVRTTDKGGRVIIRLNKHRSTKIVRHVKVKGEASPYDGNLAYWSERMGRHPECPKEVATLLKRQRGKCQHCGLHFRDGDLLEKDHVVAIVNGGDDKKNNKQLLHRHCHDTKTALDTIHRKTAEVTSEGNR